MMLVMAEVEVGGEPHGHDSNVDIGFAGMPEHFHRSLMRAVPTTPDSFQEIKKALVRLGGGLGDHLS